MITEPGKVYSVTLREPIKGSRMVTHKAEVWEHDRGRYYVQRIGAKEPHLVSPAAFNKWGKCDCDDHRTRIAPHLSRGKKPPKANCVHIRMVMKYLMRLSYNALLDQWTKENGDDKQPGPTQGQEG